MSVITTGTSLRKLRLGDMAQALEHQFEQPGTYEELDFLSRLDLLIDHELQGRRQRKQQRLLKAAEFRLPATLNSIDYRRERNLVRQQIAELGQCHWIERGHNLLVVGPTGSGKTHVATALGHAACLLDHSVYYARLTHLLMRFDQARTLGTYPKVLHKIASVALLIIDDWGLQPLEVSARHDLLELLDRRYMRASTAFISQLPVDQWHAGIGDATLADAILDRLIHNAHRIQLKGESMRKLKAPDLGPATAQNSATGESGETRTNSDGD